MVPPSGDQPQEQVRLVWEPALDLDTVLRFADLVVEDLAVAREEIDALNVYPVPDGDTGTNMYLTVAAARDVLRDRMAEGDLELAEGLGVYARGALMGARGNSGVILSQLIGALLRRIARAWPDERPERVLADGYAEATEAAYAAVGTPVEGTILSVSRAASEAAQEAAAEDSADLDAVLDAAVLAADEALVRTPEQLALLREAGVVDAGGRGLCVVLHAARAAVTGKRAPAEPRQGPVIPVVHPVPTGDLTADGPAYEVMYLLDADDSAIPELRTRLAGLGDSLVVVGGEGLWNVHVHVDDVGSAVEAGIEAGRPSRIRVTHFAEQVSRARERHAERGGRAVVVAAAGPGLAEVFAGAGARVIEGGPGRRPSTAEFLAAIEATGAHEVIVLPNDPDSLRVAEIAAHTAEEGGDVRVVVVPTQAQVQGIAAIAVHEPGRAFDADVVQMAGAARGARHGAVTVAARQAMTMAGPCEPGDVLGVVQGDFVVVGDDRTAVAIEVAQRLLGGGGELVTLVTGVGGDGLAEHCVAWLAEHHRELDVQVYDGGQERYQLLMAVE